MERRLNHTPLNISSHKLPRLPIVGRWDAFLDFEDEMYGDLAAIVGNPSYREPRRIRFRTDEAGFRNDVVPDLIDLLILGDSFSAGGGVTQDRIFAQLLASRYGFRTYNLAYPGGPYDQYINFAIEWARLSFASTPQMIWTFFTGNDLDDAGGEVWDLDALPWRSSVGQVLVKLRTFRNRSPVNRLMENLRARWAQAAAGIPEILVRALPDGRPVLFFAKHEAWATKPRSEVEQHPNFAKLERTMAAVRKLADERSIGVTVLLLPTKGEVYPWIVEERPMREDDENSSGFAQAVLEACERVRLRCLDTKPYLVREAKRLFESSGQLLWWRDDTHLGECGHEAVARFIAEEVLEIGRRGIQGGEPSRADCV